MDITLFVGNKWWKFQESMSTEDVMIQGKAVAWWVAQKNCDSKLLCLEVDKETQVCLRGLVNKQFAIENCHLQWI
jgi:hypothetical protein